MMYDPILYIIAGYLSGSVLYSKLFAACTKSSDTALPSEDKNPGAFNAFRYGGFLCGAFVLLGDVFKAFIPVFLYIHFISDPWQTPLAALVLAAPVLGHLFPIFFFFQGGKGIASTFGVLLALFPIWQPVVTLAALFIIFSCIIQITPHYYLTLLVYGLFLLASFLLPIPNPICLGMALICSSVLVKLFFSPEKNTILEVIPVWKR